MYIPTITLTQGSVSGFQQFTADGNFIVPSGITWLVVECIGGGGGGTTTGGAGGVGGIGECRVWWG